MRGAALVTALLAGSACANAGLNVTTTCHLIAKAISNKSAVFWPGSPSYTQDNLHWATSSSDVSTCSVEPGTAQDVGKILQILGTTKTPFAVKGGGHATNAGFSSTTGVLVAMSRFSNVTYNSAPQTVDYGTGIIWDDVYEALEPFGVNIVGGRVSGVGVAGFSLGGGYSWLTNQHGLTVDNVAGFEIVLPNGQVTEVTRQSDADLFFSVLGGYNNFGIVTRITAKAYPQGQVWGGIRVILGVGDNWDALNNATAKFQAEVTDPKAQILPTYNIFAGTPAATVIMFYDGTTPPAGIFDDLMAIPAAQEDVSTRSFLSLVQATPSSLTTRAVFNTVSLTTLSPSLMRAVVNETQFWAAKLTPASANFISYDVEPFLTSLFTHGTVQATAYPPTRARGLLPLNIYYAWDLAADDAVMQAAIKQSAAHLKAVAVAEGQNVADAPVYGNYAAPGTSVQDVFGDSLPRMRKTKQRIDPHNVMALAGGWKV
ncbi:FAD dependent oxidoreductase [Phanerochaete sordida]|uniref:FAD dependent oxidoreductase n=1 Tax=Phanerochaete sordida TaxID=48140 RepID=A0A9P3GBK0_9APHY|nr:FAD dependent oxidoreductase [Phanerochaete sordida]